MGLLFMALHALSDHLHQSRIEHGRQREILVEAPLPAQRLRRNRFRPKLRQSELLKGHARQIQSLRATVIGLSIHTILVIPVRTLCDPLLRFEQQHRPGPKDHRSSRTYARASRLQALVQARATQLALRHARIKSFPLESRHVIWARDRAVPASDTLLLGPTDDPALGILMECLKWTSRRTCWIQTVHALPFHVRED